jgi:hypothetical protein
MIPSIIFIVAATINMLWIFVVRTDRVYAPDINDFMYYLTSLSPAFIGLVLSILLRIVAEGVLLLMDLEIDLRERIDRQV